MSFLRVILIFLFPKICVCYIGDAFRESFVQILRLYKKIEIVYNKVTGQDSLSTLAALFGKRVISDPPISIPLQKPSQLRLVAFPDVLRYADYAGAAYCDRKALNNNFKQRPEFMLIRVIQNGTLQTQCFVAVGFKRQEIIVSFRGTFNPTNVYIDASFAKIKSPMGDGALLHEGNFKATMSLYYKLLHTLRRLVRKYPTFKVVLTGHSLGGAIAVQSYYFLSQELQSVNFVLVTYGEPRGGNRRFAEIINSKSIPLARVVHTGDMIPHLMPWSEGYVHHGTEYWDSKGKVQICSNSVYEDTNCSASLPPRRLIFADHVRYFDRSSSFLRCIISHIA